MITCIKRFRNHVDTNDIEYVVSNCRFNVDTQSQCRQWKLMTIDTLDCLWNDCACSPKVIGWTSMHWVSHIHRYFRPYTLEPNQLRYPNSVQRSRDGWRWVPKFAPFWTIFLVNRVIYYTALLIELKSRNQWNCTGLSEREIWLLYTHQFPVNHSKNIGISTTPNQLHIHILTYFLGECLHVVYVGH